MTHVIFSFGHRLFKCLLYVGVVGCSMQKCAYGEVVSVHQDMELSAVNDCLNGFITAYNTKDADRISKMSGKVSGRILRWVKGDEKIVGIEIENLSTGEIARVDTKVTLSKGTNMLSSVNVIYKMRKVSGTYSIEDVSLPESDKQNQELVDAYVTMQNFVAAINERKLDAVRCLTSFSDTGNFEMELTSRGLTWIKEAMEAESKISAKGVSVYRGRNGVLVGEMKVPDKLTGTNMVYRLGFKADKIDRVK